MTKTTARKKSGKKSGKKAGKKAVRGGNGKLTSNPGEMIKLPGFPIKGMEFFKPLSNAATKWPTRGQRVFTITEPLATSMLTLNLFNRPLCIPHVKTMAEKMRNGQFQVFVINIAYLKDVKEYWLGNAQHCLEAILLQLKEGFQRDAWVVVSEVKNREDYFNWFAEFDVDDKKRSLGDLCAIYVLQKGYEGSAIWPQIARTLSWVKWCTKQERQRSQLVAKLLGDDELKKERKLLWDMFARRHPHMPGMARKKLVQPGVMLSFLWAWKEKRARAKQFFETLLTDEDPQGREVGNCPARNLRDFLLTKITSGSGKTRKSNSRTLQINGVASMAETVMKSWSDELLGRYDSSPCIVRA